jgi:hypothetical protein
MPGTAGQFVKSIQLARLAEVPGSDGVKAWLPQVSALLQWLDPSIVKQVQPDASVVGVPLTEVPVTGGPDRPQLAVMLSGDGGWALLDRAVTAELAKNGFADHRLGFAELFLEGPPARRSGLGTWSACCGTIWRSGRRIESC